MVPIIKAIFVGYLQSKTGCLGGRCLQRCSNRDSSIGAGSSSSDSGSRIGWSVVPGMSDIKIPQTLAFHVPGQPLRCHTPSVLLITFLSFLGHLLLLSVCSSFLHPHVPSLPHFRSPLLHFTLDFFRRIFRHPCRKPSCPHFLSRYLAIFRRLLAPGRSAAYEIT